MLLSEISPVEMTYLGKIDHQCFTQGCYKMSATWVLPSRKKGWAVAQWYLRALVMGFQENSASSRWESSKDCLPNVLLCGTLSSHHFEAKGPRGRQEGMCRQHRFHTPSDKTEGQRLTGGFVEMLLCQHNGDARVTCSFLFWPLSPI